MAIQESPKPTTGERPLARWDPFEDLRQEMTRLWSSAWPAMPWSVAGLQRRLTPEMPWAPSMDIYEKDNTVVIKAELPGVKREDIDIALDNGALMIRGERKSEQEVKEEAFYRMERSYGSFQRRIPLPFKAQPDQIEANFSDGVLELRIPRPAEAQVQPQKIAIK